MPLNLDTLERIPDFEFTYQGTLHKFDTLTLCTQMVRLQGKTTPDEVRSVLADIFKMPFSTQEAYAITREFETLSTKYEKAIRDLFGIKDPPPPTTPTTDVKPG